MFVGRVYCFGYAKQGQLGDHDTGQSLNVSSPKKLIKLEDSISTVICGGAFTVAISENGEVFSWGVLRETNPKKMAAFRGIRITKVACGAMHSVALEENVNDKSDQTSLFYWDTSMKSSNPNNLPKKYISEPKRISFPSNIRIVDIACGAEHTLVLSDLGIVFGMNTISQLGLTDVEVCLGDPPFIEIPSKFGGYPVTKIACGGSHSIAITEKGTVYVWGENKFGQLGLGDMETHPVPTLLDLKQPVKSATCGDYHTILIMADDSVYVFGSNKNGQLGVGEVGVNQLTPRLLCFPDGAKKVIHIAAGGECNYSHTLALTEHGNLYSWGFGAYGQLGHGDNLDYPTPKLLKYFQGKKVNSVSCGNLHTCVVVLEEYVPPIIQITNTNRNRITEPRFGWFDNCPNDVLFLIMSSLNRHDLVKLGSCSSLLDSYIRNSKLWKRLYLLDLCPLQDENVAIKSVHQLSQKMDWKDIYKIVYIEMFDRSQPIIDASQYPTLPPAQPSLLGIVSQFISSFRKDPQYKFLIVGLDAAGKSTLVYKLKIGVPYPGTLCSVGFNVETGTYKNIFLTAFDLGGQEKMRPLWRHYYQNTDAIIFIIDSHDRWRICEAATELIKMLAEDELQGKPLLILANKQDVPGALTPYQLAVELGLCDPHAPLTTNHQCFNYPDCIFNAIKLKDQLKERLWCIQPSIILTGDGIYEGLDWLLGRVKK